MERGAGGEAIPHGEGTGSEAQKNPPKSWHTPCFNPYQQTVDLNHCLAIVNKFNDKEKEL